MVKSFVIVVESLNITLEIPGKKRKKEEKMIIIEKKNSNRAKNEIIL
jgi:hypothetical protein